LAYGSGLLLGLRKYLKFWLESNSQLLFNLKPVQLFRICEYFLYIIAYVSPHVEWYFCKLVGHCRGKHENDADGSGGQLPQASTLPYCCRRWHVFAFGMRGEEQTYCLMLSVRAC